MSDKPQTTPAWRILGKISYALMWPFGLISFCVFGAIDGAKEGGRRWIRITPEIWKGMSQ